MLLSANGHKYEENWRNWTAFRKTAEDSSPHFGYICAFSAVYRPLFAHGSIQWALFCLLQPCAVYLSGVY